MPTTIRGAFCKPQYAMENAVMGYVEMVKWDKETLKPYILYIDEDGELQREDARQCDNCYEQTRISKLYTVFTGNNDDWLEICAKCKGAER